MKCMKWILLLPLALLLSVPTAHAAVRKADARTLLGMAQTGLSQMVRAGQASSGRLDRGRSEQRPYWSALDKMGPALQRVRAGMVARDSSFFRALEDGSADLAELKVVWARTGAPDAAVSAALRVLSSSYELLRTGYGREAVRHRMAFALMPAERERFLRIQRTQERLAQVLRDLEERARRRGDEAARAELARMAGDAWRVASAQLTLNAYLNALILADDQRGEWTANAQYASADDSSGWQEGGTVVEELYVEADIGQVFMVDLGDVGDGGDLEAPAAPNAPSPGVATLTPASAPSFLDEPTEVPGDLAEAVEAYEPSPVMVMEDGTDDVDPVEEEEALAQEEVMVDETGAETEEVSDLTVYEDIEDPEAEPAEAIDEAVKPESADEASEVEVEDLPVEEPAAAPAATPEDAKAATAAPAAGKPEEKKATARADKPAPKPKPAGKTSKKKSAKPPA